MSNNTEDILNILHVLDTGAVLVEDDLSISWTNKYFDQHYFSDQKNLTDLCRDLKPVEDDNAFLHILEDVKSKKEYADTVVECHLSDNEAVLCDVWIYPMSGERLLLVCQLQTQNKTAHCEALLQMARYDPATTLPNRIYFLEMLEEKLTQQQHPEALLSIMIIDFNEIDTYDTVFSITSDELLLLTLKERLTDVSKEHTLFARVAPSKFAIVCETEVTPIKVQKLAQEILHLFSEPISVEGHLVYAELSVGISLYPTDANNAKNLLLKAEKTASAIQKTELNSYGFAHKLPEKNVDKILKISTDLPAAVENEEIFFVFQPQYCLDEGRFCGAELLARWEHPELGFISPEIFIPLAEQTGMIRTVTMKAFMEASKMFKALEGRGIKDFSLSVNISPNMLLYNGFMEDLEFFIESYEMADKALYLEVTENDFARNFSKMIDALNAIRDMGIKIEMDDYGTGYTSLQYLSKLPIDTLKIDRSFVQDIDSDQQQAVLFKAICDMASALGYDIVAEGVETEAENRVVQQYKNVRVQGYYYSKPLQVNELFELLEKAVVL